MIHTKIKNTFKYYLTTFTFIFVMSIFSHTVSSEVVMKNNNGEIIEPDFKGEVFKCETSNGTFYDVYTDGLQKVYENGVISREVTWKNCQENGKYKNYRDGFIYEEGFYKDGLKTGEWTLYNEETGFIRSIKNYKNNKLDGLSTVFLSKEYKVQDGVLESETEYKEGLKDGVEKLYREGELVDVKTHVQNTLNGEFTKYITLDEYRGQTHREILDLHNFFKVMGPRGWRYLKEECPSGYDKIDCVSHKERNQILLPNDTRLEIKGNYQSGLLQGLLTITDRDDGHVYTTIDYFRNGKFGEYKITNKEGLVIYSVNCLRGGGDIQPEGNCLKDGEEIIYKRTENKDGKKLKILEENYSPEQNHGWFIYEKINWKNGRKNGEYIGYCESGNIRTKRTYTDNRLDRLTGPVDSSLDLNCEGNTNTKSSNSNPIEKELDNVKKELEKLKKFNPFKKK